MQKNKISVGLILALVITFLWSGPLEAKKKKSTDHLSEKYKRWLDEVYYIITKREREVFLKLKTDRERDILVEAFWRHRDPTPGTPENEFKEEHYRRLRHVETRYGRSKTRKGWQTDRGKVYIILGPPIGIQEFTSYTKVYPTEVWHYQIDPRADLPHAFNIVFFDKNNTGEFVLYSPSADGPQRLLIGYQGKPGDYLEAYEQLAEFNTFLARTAMSLIPGEESTAGQPSMTSDFLLRNIEMAPKKDVEDIYASKYLKYKGLVEVEYSANYTNSKSVSGLIADSAGNYLLHYLIQLDSLAVDRYDDLFYTSIDLYGSLTDKKGDSIYQFEKNFDVKLNPQQFQRLQKSFFAVADLFPVIPGDYKLSIVLKNTNSKEFTVYDADLSVPGPSDRLSLSGPLLAYGIRNPGLPSPANTPFGTRRGQLLLDPENKFTRSDRLHVFFQLGNLAAELKNSGTLRLDIKGEKGFRKTASKTLSQSRGDEGFLVQVPLNEFPVDYYELELVIEDGTGTVMARRSKRFMISPLANVSRPQVFSKSSSLNREAVNAFILGSQYMNAKQPDRALSLMQKAYNLNPNIKQFAMGLAHVYLQLKRYDKVETILTPFITPDKPDFQVYFLLAGACQKTGKYDKAVDYYRKLISYHGPSPGVLNALASSYYNLGQPDEARKAWEHSLRVDPRQEKVKKALKELTNENK
jgi:GWxTD domain-containing protein